MNIPSKLTLQTCLAWWLLCWLLALGMAVVPTTIAYADNCATEPWNLADCLRTPGYRETYVELLLAAGVLPTTISQILSEASKTSLNDQDLNRFITDQILPGFRKAFKKGIASNIGGNLAGKTADILDNWGKDGDPSAPPPPQVKIPYKEDASRQTKPPPAKEIPVEVIYDYSPGAIVSGKAARDFLTGTGALDKISQLRKGDSWDDKIKALEGKPGKITITDFSIEWNGDGTPNLDNLVFVIPDNAPPNLKGPSDQVPEEPSKEDASKSEEEKKGPKSPPDGKKEPVPTPEPPKEKKPLDLKDQWERFHKERDAALALKNKLTDEARKLAEKMEKLKSEWDHTRVKAVTNGIVDCVDIFVDITKKPAWLQTETKIGAYVKDLGKNVIKLVAGEVFTDGLQLSDLSKIKGFDVYKLFASPTGLPDGLLSGSPVETIKKDPWRLIDYVLPGGATKQQVQNWIKPKSEGISEALGPIETGYKAVMDARDAAKRCEELRAEMQDVGSQASKVRNAIQDAETDYELADHSVRRNEANIKELKDMFPNRFRHW